MTPTTKLISGIRVTRIRNANRLLGSVSHVSVAFNMNGRVEFGWIPEPLWLVALVVESETEKISPNEEKSNQSPGQDRPATAD